MLYTKISNLKVLIGEYGNMREYQRCKRCVMDTTDSKITFDENGICDHCRNFDKNIAPYWKADENRFDEVRRNY